MLLHRGNTLFMQCWTLALVCLSSSNGPLPSWLSTRPWLVGCYCCCSGAACLLPLPAHDLHALSRCAAGQGVRGRGAGDPDRVDDLTHPHHCAWPPQGCAADGRYSSAAAKHRARACAMTCILTVVRFLATCTRIHTHTHRRPQALALHVARAAADV